MYQQANNAQMAYAQNDLNVESKEKLVEMMYEGILRFTSLIKRNFDDIEKRVYYINRVIAIFSELIASLDFEQGGTISHYLNGLYVHQIKLLTEANMHNDEEKIDIVTKVAKGLIEAWRETIQNLGKTNS
jgi:flagellar protein FliS